ncbi:MAG: peptide chain release factor aRF-1 [Thermoplasmata archaeon]|nr:peptide chain release factor aRF-1 [Candidatus Sysuiplasma acidicola]MBX8646568.1 peptide chain release factor aRF-1 [Candidatus Sysuiplasma acidicola]MDH2906448.1 peptide chain release factor aRF-1 [Methanomassiliicoccales archaeon]
MEITEKQRYDFRREIERIAAYRGRGTELISLYVPAGKMISDVANYLREEQSQSSNIKSSSTRKNVQSAISSILSRLKGYKMLAPENGIAFFVGTVPKNGNSDQTTMVQHVIEPPEPVPTFLYRCDSSFYLDPLNSMIEVKDVYGLIVIDRKEATIGFLRGQSIQVAKNMHSQVPSKHRMGGQSSLRFERLIEIAANEYYKNVAEVCTNVFLNVKNLSGILVGGPGSTKDFFVKEGYLHYELQKKVIDTFDAGYTDEYGLRELVEKARERLKDLDIMKQKLLIERLLSEIRKPDSGLGAYGLKEVVGALNAGAVSLLLISEGLKKMIREYTCSSCGNVMNVTKSDEDSTAPPCEKCSAQTTMTGEKDLVDELFEKAEQMDTQVELISSESEEGKMLMTAFSGIAAILRYRTVT